MYKFTAHLTKNSHLYLIRPHINDGRCSVLVLRAQQYAIKCDETKECPESCVPKKKSWRKYYWTLGALLFAGATVTYAKYSLPTRKWLDENAPWASNFVGAVFQEKKTYGELANEKWNKISKTVEEFLFGKEGVTPLIVPSKADQDLEADAEKAFAPKSYIPTIVQTDKCETQKPLVIKVTEEQKLLEQDMYKCTKTAVDQYNQALKLCEKYNIALAKVVENPIESIEAKDMTALKGVMLERDTAYKKASEASACAKCAIETLNRQMRKKGVQVPPEDLAVLQRYCRNFMTDIEKSEKAYKECMEKSVLANAYWDKVKEARKFYKEELKALFPDLDIKEKKPLITNDTDMLILYNMKQVQYLQNKLAEMETIREMKLNRAIECKDEKALIDEKVENTINKERLKQEQELKKKELQILADAERKLREDLKKQYMASQDALNERIKKKEKEMEKKFNKTVNEQLTQERLEHKQQLAEMSGRLRAIEDTLKKRQQKEAEQKKSLEMWTAAEALLAATRKPEPKTPVKDELKALEKAGKDDKMVKEVMKGIKPEVKDGKEKIATEKALHDKFNKLEKQAKDVALIGPEGASLPMYGLSWLQSKFLFNNPAEIPKEELNNSKKIDFTQLDTFDIMQRARHHMDNNNLQDAVRYVNLLSGAPRAAAQGWLKDARSHLEVKQAAEAVMANATLQANDK